MNKVSVHDLGILKDMDATDIAKLIQNREVSVDEVLNCVQERARIANPHVNAIVAEDYSINPSKNTSGIFYGVPLFVKDLINVRGFPTRYGSKGFSGKSSPKNGKGVEQMASMGFIMVGKSATSEFGFTGGCETDVHGNTRNPIHTEYSTGGSSGGAGALVASGIVPIAHAMDGGGSIRIPASHCGLIGLKPSKGRILGSISAGTPIDVTCDGVLTKTVRDTANFFNAAELFHSKSKIQPIGLVKDPIKKRLKVALLLQGFDNTMPHPEVLQETEKIARKLENLGHKVIPITNPFPINVGDAFHHYFTFLAFMNNIFAKYKIDFSFNSQHTLPFTKGLASDFTKNVHFNLFNAIRILNKSVPIYYSLFNCCDVVLTPVVSTPPPKIGYFGANLDYKVVLDRMKELIKYSPIHNVTGSPSISLPTGKSKNGLPIGSMFSAAFGNERLLLELAFEIEEVGLLLKHSDY